MSGFIHKLKKEEKKTLKDNIVDLSKSTKVIKGARKLIRKNKLIKRNRFK